MPVANPLYLNCRSLASGDVNNDGFDDLIVSAPGYSASMHFMQGAVYVVYGMSLQFPTPWLSACCSTHLKNGMSLKSR